MEQKKIVKNKKIGLVLNILDEEYQISFFSGIKHRAKELGVDLICFQHEDAHVHKDSLVVNFPRKSFFNVDGIILLTSVFSEADELRRKNDLKKIWGNIPVISVGQKIDGVTSLSIRTKKSMEDLMNHLLIDHNYKKFIFVSGLETHQDSIERQNVFTSVISKFMKKDSRISYSIIHGSFMELSAREAIAEYIEKNPDNAADAIVCANDNMALGVSKYLKTQTQNPKWKNCAVTGFDDIPQATLELPAFTTVHQPLEEMGTKAVDLIVKILDGKKTREMNYVDSTFITRQSCGCKSNKKDEKLFTMERINRLQNIYFQSEQFLRNMSRMGQQLNACAETNGLMYILDLNMAVLEIDDFAVYVFKNPLSLDGHFKETNIECKELFSRRHGKRLTEPGPLTSGNFMDFVTKFTKGETGSFVVKLLNAANGVIGCIVYNSHSFIHPYICSISTNIAQTIFKIQTLTEKQRYSELLEAEVSRRTEQLIEANNRRIQVEAEVLKISEMERQRFSTDLHDDICQRLAGIAMLCRSYTNQDEKITKEQMLEISELTSETLQITRQYAHNSYPVDLDALGLKDSIGNLCASFQAATGIKCDYEWLIPNVNPFNELQCINIFRIIQEAIHNIGKHADAKNVIVKISRAAKDIVIQIIDDGKGMSANKNGKPGLGMKSMQYRADQIDAIFKVKANVPKGTVVEIRKNVLS